MEREMIKKWRKYSMMPWSTEPSSDFKAGFTLARTPTAGGPVELLVRFFANIWCYSIKRKQHEDAVTGLRRIYNLDEATNYIYKYARTKSKDTPFINLDFKYQDKPRIKIRIERVI